jgi:hypothetical protein
MVEVKVLRYLSLDVPSESEKPRSARSTGLRTSLPTSWRWRRGCRCRRRSRLWSRLKKKTCLAPLALCLISRRISFYIAKFVQSGSFRYQEKRIIVMCSILGKKSLKHLSYQYNLLPKTLLFFFHWTYRSPSHLITKTELKPNLTFLVTTHRHQPPLLPSSLLAHP